jgi:hypothetical protein
VAFNLIIKGPNCTVATLTKAQFERIEPVLLRLANRETKPGAAEAEIERLLREAGDPLVFKPKFEVNQVWRAKKPANANGFVNDRHIRYLNTIAGVVQYDGPAVANGRHLPKVSIEVFEKWAAREVAGELPEGEWQRWDNADRSKNK